MSTPGIYVLDVGHGNSSVISFGASTLVVDAGPGSALLEFLQEQEIKKIDVLLITHADFDHINGLIGILASQSVEVGLVRLNSDAIQGSATWNDLLFELDLANSAGSLSFEPSLTTNQSDAFNLGNLRVEIPAPRPYLASRGPGSTDRSGRRLETNSITAVIRLSLNSVPLVVFMGDIDVVGLENLIESGQDLVAPIMVFPHHGGMPGTADMETFVARMAGISNPHTVIFSIARDKHRNPHPETVRAIRQAFPRVRIVCTQLSKNCSAALPRISPRHLAPVFAQGREQGKCCGGSLVIRMDDQEVGVRPEIAPHIEFISAVAQTALCMIGQS